MPPPSDDSPSPAAPQRPLRWLLGAAAAAALLAAAWLAAPALPGPQWLQSHQQLLQAQVAAQPGLYGLGFFLLFTLLSALALPGCAPLALAAGLCFGFAWGTLLVLLASTVGATLSFLAARHLWREPVRRRWGHRLARIEAGLARDGALFLFSLRLAPIVPYALVNPLMGLSAMPVRQFFVVSLLGMAAGSAAYVQAGLALGQAQRWQDLAAPGLLLPLTALALLPWVWRWIISQRRARIRTAA